MAEADNLKLALPASNEYVDVEVLNENFRKIDTSVLLALAAAAPYSAESTYAMGAYCTRGGKLYRCTTAISAVEAWTDAHWTETTMGAELIAIYTTLANKAPAGFGYGEMQSIIFWNDEDGTKLEQALESKFTPDSMRNKVFRTQLVDYPICKVSGNGGFADITADNDNDSNGYPKNIMVVFYGFCSGLTGSSIATKQKINGVWYPWEYVNPPLLIGEEYRTTERWNGAPVYAQLFDCSPMPNATTKIFPAEGTYADNISVVVDYGGMSPHYEQSLQNKGFASLNVTAGKIYITTETDLSAGTAYVWVKYVKYT